MAARASNPGPASPPSPSPAPPPSPPPLRRNPFALIGNYIYLRRRPRPLPLRTPLPVHLVHPNTVFTAPDPAVPITSVAAYGGNILTAFGTGQEIIHHLYPDASSPTLLFAGEKAHELVSYGGFAMWADARAGSLAPQTVRQVTGSGLEFKLLDSPIQRLVVAQGKAIAATRVGLYEFGGAVSEVDVRNPAYNPNDANETDPPRSAPSAGTASSSPSSSTAPPPPPMTSPSSPASAAASMPGSAKP